MGKSTAIPSKEEVNQYQLDLRLLSNRSFRREEKEKKTAARVARFRRKYAEYYS